MSVNHLRWFLVSILVMAMLLSACDVTADVKVGTSVPDFSAQAIQGDLYRLEDLRGQTILLSFINTQARADSATPDPSRSQIVFLKSMQEQYGLKGLAVIIIDAARIIEGKNPGQDELINFTYDWKLNHIPVLDDSRGSIARAYAVESTPTTFLIDSDGIIRQRWDGYASASQLALSIESLVGAPAHRQSDETENTATSYMPICSDEAQPQARFSGVGLARSFSNELWVVDSGLPWGVGADFPLQWIFIDTQSIIGEETVHIQVFGRYTDSQQSILLIEQPMELLPAAIANGLLSGDSDSPKIYSLVTTILLERPGCLEVQALVIHEETGSILYRGETLIVPAR